LEEIADGFRRFVEPFVQLAVNANRLDRPNGPDGHVTSGISCNDLRMEQRSKEDEMKHWGAMLLESLAQCK